MRKLKHVWRYEELIGATPVFKKLKIIKIRDCESLESLFAPSASNNNNTSNIEVDFSELETLEMKSLKMFRYMFQGNVNMKLPVVQRVELTNLREMVAFAKLKKQGEECYTNDTPIPLFIRQMVMPYLEYLHLEQLHKVKNLWDMTTTEEFSLSFPTLKSLFMQDLPEVKYIWGHELNETTNVFKSLVYITIADCDKIESLFSFRETSRSPHLVSFPRLQYLGLGRLPSFRSFVSHQFSDIEFEAPALTKLTISFIPLVNTILCFNRHVEFSSVEELQIVGMSEIESISSDDDDAEAWSSVFPQLVKLYVDGVDEMKLKRVLGRSILHKLQSLEMVRLKKLKYLVSPDDERVSAGEALVKSLSELENLEELTIEECNLVEGLFEVGQQNDSTVTWLLPCLRRLRLVGLVNLNSVQWHMLPNIQSLVSINCPYTSSEEEFLIPATTVATRSSLQSLESMTFTSCHSMKAIIGGVVGIQEDIDDYEIVFPLLKEVKLQRMRSLCMFSSAEGGGTMRFPCLESIEFEDCGILTLFSAGGPAEAPKLSNLKVNNEAVTIYGDLNTALEREFDSKYKITEHWPRLLRNTNEEHCIHLTNLRKDETCNGCGESVMSYSYTCFVCNFDLHPVCAMNHGQLNKLADGIKVGKDYCPKALLKEELHEHELKLAAGGDYLCDECGEMGVLFSYYCEICKFDLHPNCALQTANQLQT